MMTAKLTLLFFCERRCRKEKWNPEVVLLHAACLTFLLNRWEEGNTQRRTLSLKSLSFLFNLFRFEYFAIFRLYLLAPWLPEVSVPRIRVCSVLLLLVGCLTSQQHGSVAQGRICSDNCTCCHTQKLQIKLSISSIQSILTPGQQVPALTLYSQAPDRIATEAPILSHWYDYPKNPHGESGNTSLPLSRWTS